jgi:hypothetical protein
MAVAAAFKLSLSCRYASSVIGSRAPAAVRAWLVGVGAEVFFFATFTNLLPHILVRRIRHYLKVEFFVGETNPIC